MSQVTQSTQQVEAVGDVALKKEEPVVEKSDKVTETPIDIGAAGEQLEKAEEDEEEGEEEEEDGEEQKEEGTQEADVEKESSQQLSQAPVAVVPPTKRVLDEAEKDDEVAIKKVKVLEGGDADVNEVPAVTV